MKQVDHVNSSPLCYYSLIRVECGKWIKIGFRRTTLAINKLNGGIIAEIIKNRRGNKV